MSTAVELAENITAQESLSSDAGGVNPSLAAFEKLLPKILAVDVSNLATINVGLFHVVSTMLGAMPAIRDMRPLLVEHFKKFDLEQFDELEQRVLAVNWAHAMWRATLSPKRDLTQLAAVVLKRRDDLIAACGVLAHFGYVEKDLAERVGKDRSYQSLSADVLTMVNVLRPIWKRVGNMTPLEHKDLDEAASEALDLQIAIGIQQQTPMPRTKTATVRYQAYTLFRQAYVPARRAAIYLFGEEGADAVVPTLYEGRGGRRSEREEESETEAEATGELEEASDDVETEEPDEAVNSGVVVNNPQNLPLKPVFANEAGKK